MNIENLKRLKNIVKNTIRDNFDYDQDYHNRCLFGIIKTYAGPGKYSILLKGLTRSQIIYLSGMSQLPYKTYAKSSTINYHAEILGLPECVSFTIHDLLRRIDNLIFLVAKDK